MPPNQTAAPAAHSRHEYPAAPTPRHHPDALARYRLPSQPAVTTCRCHCGRSGQPFRPDRAESRRDREAARGRRQGKHRRVLGRALVAIKTAPHRAPRWEETNFIRLRADQVVKRANWPCRSAASPCKFCARSLLWTARLLLPSAA